MMISDIYMLGARAHFVYFCHFKRTVIVFKGLAMHLWGIYRIEESMLLEFFDETHDWNCFPERLG